MTIREVTENKKAYLPLLLLADEQEDMVDAYLDRGRMFVLEDGGGVRGQCVVTDEGGGVLELKSLSVEPGSQGRGYGRRLVRFIEETCQDGFHTLQVGTGDSPLTLPFYEKLGFVQSHRVPDFFLIHYRRPIFEAGVQLRDMVYLKKSLHPGRSVSADGPRA